MSHDGQGLKLIILSGFHAGAHCILPDHPLTVGANPVADVILHDEDVAGIHLVLEPDGGDLRIVVRAAGVTVADTPLKEGEIVVAALPVTIVLAGVELRCESAARVPGVLPADDRVVVVRSATTLLPKTPVARAASIGLLGIVVVAIVGIRVLAGNNGQAYASSQLRGPEAGRTVATPESAALRGSVEDEVKLLGLSNVSLVVDAGIVTVGGRIDPFEAPKIHALEIWFDHRFGESAVLLSQVALVKPEILKIALQSVWDGPDPNIVVGGQRYGKGAALPDGSIVQQITDHTVSFVRDGQPYSLEY